MVVGRKRCRHYLALLLDYLTYTCAMTDHHACVPFHLAMPVHDLAAARAFYVGILGCPEGKTIRPVNPIRPLPPGEWRWSQPFLRSY